MTNQALLYLGSKAIVIQILHKDDRKILAFSEVILVRLRNPILCAQKLLTQLPE